MAHLQIVKISGLIRCPCETLFVLPSAAPAIAATPPRRHGQAKQTRMALRSLWRRRVCRCSSPTSWPAHGGSVSDQ